jgi:hypothetical protein
LGEPIQVIVGIGVEAVFGLTLGDVGDVVVGETGVGDEFCNSPIGGQLRAKVAGNGRGC